jgi:hypothetical protein
MTMLRNALVLLISLATTPLLAQEVPMTAEPVTPELALETPAPAPPPRRLGIGANATLGGMIGAELEIGIGALALDVTGGLLVDDETTIGLGAALFLPIRLHERVELRIGGRFGFLHTTGGAGEPPYYGTGGTGIFLEAPLRLQIHLTSRLSAHTEIGPTLAIVTDGAVLGRAKGVYLLLDQPGTVASFGFTFWVD